MSGCAVSKNSNMSGCATKPPQGKQPLTPRKVINVGGKVHYSESNQAWNTIKLKKEFLNEFKQLKEKRSSFSYEMIFGRSEDEMVEAIKKIIKDKTLMPVLMFLYKD